MIDWDCLIIHLIKIYEINNKHQTINHQDIYDDFFECSSSPFIIDKQDKLYMLNDSLSLAVLKIDPNNNKFNSSNDVNKWANKTEY